MIVPPADRSGAAPDGGAERRSSNSDVVSRPRWLGVVLWIAAAAFAVAGVSHLVRGIAQAPDDPQSPLRHAVFVGIDALAVVLLVARPRWLAAPIAALTVQQLTTHGWAAWSAIAAGAWPKPVDLTIAIALPVLTGLLVHDAWARRPRGAASGRAGGAGDGSPQSGAA